MTGPSIKLLTTGQEFFPALLTAVRAATQEIHIETYIFANDARGIEIANALAAAAARGVEVRVLVDGFGNRAHLSWLRRTLGPPGVLVRVYRPVAWLAGPWHHRFRRLHRKLISIDGTLAFCGGINLQTDGVSGAAPRFDFAVRVTGSIVAEVQRAQRRLWSLVELTNLHYRPNQWRSRIPRGPSADADIAFVTRDNLHNRRRIEDVYLAALRSAHSDAIIACAYFLPGARFRRALISAASRGVRVRLLLQGQPDHPLIYRASRALYRELLMGGVEIHEYAAAHLHAKAGVVDSHWATVGSSNIDPFSLWLSREANVVVKTPTLVQELRETLAHAIADHARKIDLENLAALPPLSRLANAIAYRFARLAATWIGAGADDSL